MKVAAVVLRNLRRLRLAARIGKITALVRAVTLFLPILAVLWDVGRLIRAKGA